MKVQQQQQFRSGFLDDHDEESKTYLSLGCYNRLRSGNVDLKSFIKPECSYRKDVAHPPNSDFKNKHSFHAGGTRWNPTEEQIGILEALYSTGIRTPTAHQIDHITAQLSNYGKIEGKNVFYWFQNHKARERQRRNRTNTTPNTTSITFSFDSTKEEYWKRKEEQAASPLSKRKCTSWTFDSPEPIISTHNTTHNYNDSSNYCNSSTEVDEEEDGVSKITLHLFPLHPETR